MVTRKLYPLLTVLILALGAMLMASCGEIPGPTPVVSPPPATAVPTAEASPPPIETLPAPPTPAPGCTDRASFVADVTVPDNSIFGPGQPFVKTWRLRNDGTCTWSTSYALVFARGDAMGGPAAVPFPGSVAPGEEVDLSLTLVAPAGAGTYTGYWQLANARGERFGLAGGSAFLVQIVVPAATAAPTLIPPTPVPPTAALPTPVPPTPVPITDWRGEYYNNTVLSGDPALVRNDVTIDFDWGIGAPAPGLPADNFSVRWTRRLPFAAGQYRFSALVDDGMRLWIDGALVLDAWKEGATREVTADYTLSEGYHDVRIEYLEFGGHSRIRVSWDLRPSIPAWRGEYYANRNLEGSPALVRDDVLINFNWGAAAPVPGLPADNFSVRWTQAISFEEATYRFMLLVDDGARLYIDGRIVLDAWQDGGPREVQIDHPLRGGVHDLKLEYYERAGNAQVRLRWEKVDRYFPDWKGEYWTNPTLSGIPRLVQNEGRIDFDWGPGSAAAGMPVDNWSARWTRSVYLEAATYRFHVVVNDGARVWLDGLLIIDSWRDGGTREITVDRTVTKGYRNLRVEYYERTGGAVMRLWWEVVAPGNYPDWKGQYWNNMNMSGSPQLVRNDAAIDFDWGTGAPAPGVGRDRFSARWERWVNLEPGTYIFQGQADNGIMAYLDDQLIIDGWYSNGQEVFSYRTSLGGPHRLVVEYYDNAGPALVKFWWHKER